MSYITVLFTFFVSALCYGVGPIDTPHELDRQFQRVNHHRAEVVENEEKPINLLSIDGGGVRGVIPAKILESIESRLGGRSIHEVFDLVAGTSTGGLIAVGLSAPENPKDFHSNPISAGGLVRFYKDFSREVFPRADGIFGSARNGLWSALISPSYAWNGYYYSEKPLEKRLEKTFGELCLSNLKMPTVITSINARSRKLKLFRSYRSAREVKEGENSPLQDGDFLLRDVCRATSAAPTYFASARVKSSFYRDYTLIDGGLGANDPTLFALTEAMNIFGRERKYNLVSIGTGSSYETYPATESGLFSKPTEVIGTLMDAQVDLTTKLLDSVRESGILENVNYLGGGKLQCPINTKISPMDHSENIDLLIQRAKDYLESDDISRKINEIVAAITE